VSLVVLFRGQHATLDERQRLPPRNDASTRGTQHQRHRPHLAQQPPHPPQPQPRQTRQPRQPQPRHPRQATCCRSPTVSRSNRWKVARLTSAISSSPSTKRWLAGMLWDCGISAVGVADAALPVTERPSPAAPSVVIAAMVVLPFAACFLFMVASSACWSFNLKQKSRPMFLFTFVKLVAPRVTVGLPQARPRRRRQTWFVRGAVQKAESRALAQREGCFSPCSVAVPNQPGYVGNIGVREVPLS